jgi:hypothetical protein
LEIKPNNILSKTIPKLATMLSCCSKSQNPENHKCQHPFSFLFFLVTHKLQETHEQKLLLDATTQIFLFPDSAKTPQKAKE